VPDRWRSSDTPRGAAYDARFHRLAAAGVDVHGEADLVDSYGPTSVLDAGCGTGRVALELHRRGRTVMGLDLDRAMLAAAREKAPELRWVEGDLADPALDLGLGDGSETFDLIVMAGNVLIFVEPGTEGTVLANAARWLALGGRLITGYSLSTPGVGGGTGGGVGSVAACSGGLGGSDGFGPAALDALAAAVGLALEDRWATWDRVPFTADANYACSVHRKVC
jgi:SAM-dependent methyltransferase